MARKADRLGPTATVDDGLTIRLGPLTSGASFGDAPPLIAEPDVQTSLVDVRCYCGATVAVLWSNDRRVRTGLTSFLFLQSQIIDDPDARPVRTRIVEDLVHPGDTFVTVCQAHGPQIVRGAVLVNLARETQERISKGRERMGKYVLPRVSLA